MNLSREDLMNMTKPAVVERALHLQQELLEVKADSHSTLHVLVMFLNEYQRVDDRVRVIEERLARTAPKVDA